MCVVKWHIDIFRFHTYIVPLHTIVCSDLVRKSCLQYTEVEPVLIAFPMHTAVEGMPLEY